jgi:hypothetical protein
MISKWGLAIFQNPDPMAINHFQIFKFINFQIDWPGYYGVNIHTIFMNGKQQEIVIANFIR